VIETLVNVEGAGDGVEGGLADVYRSAVIGTKYLMLGCKELGMSRFDL
jgi:hypothetical protein